MNKLNRRVLKSYLRYYPSSGKWTWMKSPTIRVKVGSRAGAISTRGYRQIALFGRTYTATRLAWFYMTGKWPTRHIDHKNTVSDDDRWKNLRLATREQNLSNSRMRCDNTSGHKGVYFNAKTKRWYSKIGHRRTSIYLGYFDTAELAALAYTKTAKELKGEFARVR